MKPGTKVLHNRKEYEVVVGEPDAGGYIVVKDDKGRYLCTDPAYLRFPTIKLSGIVWEVIGYRQARPGEWCCISGSPAYVGYETACAFDILKPVGVVNG